jgi:hypothetical protein
MFDGFLVITIGGDYMLEFFEIAAKNRKIRNCTGSKGFTDTTEVKMDMRVETKHKFDKEINIELRDSIANLMKQNLIIEVWDYNNLKLNQLQGYGMVDIMKIIRGNIFQTLNIEKKLENGSKKHFCKIDFQIIFQEIWDFYLTFEDWGATNMNYLFNKSNEEFQDNTPGIQFFIQKQIQKVKNVEDKKGAM